MKKYQSLILLLLMSAIILAPFKLPTCIKANSAVEALTIASNPCPTQQALGSNCSSSSYWFQNDYQLSSLNTGQALISLLGFFFILATYSSPLDIIFRPPI